MGNDLVSELKAVQAWEYKTVDTITVAGIEAAEKLLDDGWTIYRSGFFSVSFQRRKVNNG